MKSTQGSNLISLTLLNMLYTQIIGESSEHSFSVREVPHRWGQHSIIVRLDPLDSHNASKEVVILGAHQDSTNLLPFLRAPGADDDASGTTTLLLALKALVKAKFVPRSQ
jgi:leucyl aminopeptidase